MSLPKMKYRHKSQIVKKNVSFCLIIHSLINLIFISSSRGNVKNMKPALGVQILLKNTAKEKNILTEKYKKRNTKTAFGRNTPVMVI